MKIINIILCNFLVISHAIYGMTGVDGNSYERAILNSAAIMAVTIGDNKQYNENCVHYIGINRPNGSPFEVATDELLERGKTALKWEKIKTQKYLQKNTKDIVMKIHYCNNEKTWKYHVTYVVDFTQHKIEWKDKYDTVKVIKNYGPQQIDFLKTIGGINIYIRDDFRTSDIALYTNICDHFLKKIVQDWNNYAGEETKLNIEEKDTIKNKNAEKSDAAQPKKTSSIFSTLIDKVPILWVTIPIICVSGCLCIFLWFKKK